MRKTQQGNFVLCIKNEECEDLELRKVCQTLPDNKASKDGYLLVIDESGEDYLYPECYFVPLSLSPQAQEALSVAR